MKTKELCDAICADIGCKRRIPGKDFLTKRELLFVLSFVRATLIETKEVKFDAPVLRRSSESS